MVLQFNTYFLTTRTEIVCRLRVLDYYNGVLAGKIYTIEVIPMWKV